MWVDRKMIFFFFELQENIAIAHSLKLNSGTFYWSWRWEGSLNYFCTETRGKVFSRGMSRSFSSEFSKGAVTKKSLEQFFCHREETEAYMSFGTLHNQYEAPI